MWCNGNIDNTDVKLSTLTILAIDTIFEQIFLWGIVLPGLPDDLLCYIAGLSNISFKKFLAIIVLGKPLTLILYSVFAYVI